MELKYVSDEIDISKIDKDKLNLIVAGCGTGKSTFALKHIRTQLKKVLNENIKPYECWFVTSRALTKNQQLEGDEYIKITSRLQQIQIDSLEITDEIERELFIDSGWGTVKERKEKYLNQIPVMTYNQFSYALSELICKNIKLIIFDEIHAVLSDIKFNETMSVTKEFIKNKLNDKNNSTYIVAMTATDQEINENTMQVKLNYLLDYPIFNYKVTDKLVTVPKVGDIKSILENIDGITLIMTCSTNRMLKLKKVLGDSAALLVSKNNDYYNEEMIKLTEYIVDHKALPPGIRYFISTSCAREGFEFIPNESFKVNNVVIYNASIVDVIQFVGRYRGNIKNLYLTLDRRIPTSNMTPAQRKQRKLLEYFINRKVTDRTGNVIYGESYMKFVDNIRNILSEDISIEEYSNKSVKLNNEDEFIRWIEKNWIYRTICKQQKEIIVNKAKELGLKKKNSKSHTFNSIVNQIILKNDFELILDGKLRTVNSNNETVQKYLKKGDIIPSGTIRVTIIAKK